MTHKVVVRQEDGIKPLQGPSSMKGTHHVSLTPEALAYPRGAEEPSLGIQKPALAFLSRDP